MNPIQKLLLEFPNKEWNWSSLSINYGISIKFISDHIDLPWNYDKLSERYDLTLNFIEQNIFKPWNWYKLSSHNIVDMDFVNLHYNMPWNYRSLSNNKNIKFYLAGGNNEIENSIANEIIKNITENKLWNNTIEALEDDLNTPLVITYLYEAMKEVNKTKSAPLAQEILKILK